jgi:hypothetical protein
MAPVLISRMVTVVVEGSAKAVRASGIDIEYTVYFSYRSPIVEQKKPLLQSTPFKVFGCNYGRQTCDVGHSGIAFFAHENSEVFLSRFSLHNEQKPSKFPSNRRHSSSAGANMFCRGQPTCP